jgi:protein SCO1/2
MQKLVAKLGEWAALGALGSALTLVHPAPALAQVASELTPELQGAEIVDKPNAALPLDAAFTDERGNPVKLGDYFNDGKPVLLTLVYLRCPMLCTLVVNGMVDALQDIKYSPGQDFTMLTVSFDPLETPALSGLKRQNYLQLYNRTGAESGWHFLTGTQGNIRRLADAVGFGYKWNPAQQAYAHGSGIFVVTPDGHLSRTLYGIQFDPQTLKGSLLEAGQGSIGTPMDKVYFACLHFDSSTGQYTANVMNFTRFVALLITAITALTLVGFFNHERAQQRRGLALASAGRAPDEVHAEPGETAPADNTGKGSA